MIVRHRTLNTIGLVLLPLLVALPTLPAGAAPTAQAGAAPTARAGAAPTARAGAVKFFRTPSGSIGCAYLSGSGSDLRCDVRFSTRFQGKHKCTEGDYGQSFSMTARGRAAPRCASDTVLMTTSPVLAYGHTRRYGAFTCTSKKSGLTCRNSRRHGWTLSRQSQRLF
ncbi:MAG TPA: DUF6636 domain-containing protein [Solirubrobacteraceae bacterium]|nr:DUF6636 domain-containing protein [Solirubrobacteraceae bacterium]